MLYTHYYCRYTIGQFNSVLISHLQYIYTLAAYEQRGGSSSSDKPDSTLQGQDSANSSHGGGSGNVKVKPIPPVKIAQGQMPTGQSVPERSIVTTHNKGIIKLND